MSKGVHFWLFTILAVTLTLSPSLASADTSRGQFAVYVNVLRECRIGMQGLTTDASTVVQGAYAAHGTLALSCSRNTAYTVSLTPNPAPTSTPVQASSTGVGNGAIQLIPVDSSVSHSERHGEQTKTLFMTINY